MDCYGGFFYLDGRIHRAAEDVPALSGEVSFYEVIRTRNGVPLFFDEHMKRLRKGIDTRYDLDHDIAVRVAAGFDALVSSESFAEMNVRVTVTFIGREYSLHICYIQSSYPTEEMIRDGVRLILFRAERFDPGVKILNNRLRATVHSELQRRQAYEALLVNREGLITEGSRSNVFFITDEDLIVTPPDSMVLSGITREKVIGLCRTEGMNLMFRSVAETDLPGFRSLFITGTSPMVLRVHSVEDQYFEVACPVTEKLRLLYERLVLNSISSYKMRNRKD
ncbi:MAG: aminotransferase class IV [Bacteroidales bacterium]|nr:aminotransferase class IV [Bacteroidales bacterium]MDT8372823.1 aminotransferase class IV [Bacteroidales bacterium]